MRYELWDTDTGNLIAQAETMDGLLEIEVRIRDSGADITTLQILEWVDGEQHLVVQ